MAFSIPFGVGVKYCINERINVGFEIVHRVTGTDYLDDVSTTYVDPSIFPTLPDGDPSPAYLLHDRSYEVGEPIGIPGRQRGVRHRKISLLQEYFIFHSTCKVINVLLLIDSIKLFYRSYFRVVFLFS